MADDRSDGAEEFRGRPADGAWPSGKARDFGSRIRRFESFRPNQSVGARRAYESRAAEAVFGQRASRRSRREIAEFLGVPLGQARLQRFPDTEVSFQIDENIRGTDVFIVQPTCAPVDQHLIELCVMIDAFRRSSASRITAVIPYYGYARQDRKDKPRVPISAKLVANLLSAAGRQPRADDGSAQGADSGVLRHPGGSPVCGAGDHRLLRAARRCRT